MPERRSTSGEQPAGARRTRPGDRIEINWQLPRRNVEALQLEIRRLARRHGITIKHILIERPGEPH